MSDFALICEVLAFFFLSKAVMPGMQLDPLKNLFSVILSPASLQTVRDQFQSFGGDSTMSAGEHRPLLLPKEGGVSEVFLWRPESELLAAE